MVKLIVFLGCVVLVYAGQQEIFHHTKCEREYQNIGCFKRQKEVFVDHVLTSDNLDSKLSTGAGIDWNNFSGHLHSLACKCYEKCKGKYKFFSIGYFGECYAGNNQAKYDALINNKGQESSECMGGDYLECVPGSETECTGGEHSEYVYLIKAAEPTVPQPVNGGYGSWTTWTSCDKSCGNGHQTRERTCTNPPPSANGIDCSSLGAATEAKVCKNQECPSECDAIFGIYGDKQGIHVLKSGNAIKGDWQINKRPNFSGKFSSGCKGDMIFPDDKKYNFEYDPDSCTIFWNGRNSGNRWRKKTCNGATDFLCNYQTGDGRGEKADIEIYLGEKDNEIVCKNACIEKMKNDATINGATYSTDGRKKCWCEQAMTGIDEKDTKWKTCFLVRMKATTSYCDSSMMFGNYGQAKIANANSNGLIKGDWTANRRSDFNGRFSDECKGHMTFPDDRKYTFEYDPSTCTIYWDGRNSGNRWQKVTCPKQAASTRSCVFPFKYKGKTYTKCTNVNHNELWCSYDAEYKGKWKNCNTDCVYPFTYKGKTYHSCTSAHWTRKWCALDKDYVKGRWRHCGIGCVFPFTYKGKTYNTCTKERYHRFWCAKNTNYAGRWSNCH